MGDFFARLQLVIFWWSSKLILEDILQQKPWTINEIGRVKPLKNTTSHPQFISINFLPLPRTGDINININVWSPPSLGGPRRLQWWRLDMTTQSVIHNIHSLLSSLSAQSAITTPGRRHVSHVSLCWTKQKVPTRVLFLYKVSNSTFTLLWTGFWTSYFHMKLWCLSAKPSSLEGLVSNP